MKVKFNEHSPYAKVKQTWYLDYNLPAPLFPADIDREFTIEPKYHEQPWKLAKDLYGEERLYYIFSLLNVDDLVDPVYDFKQGLTIKIPAIARVQNWLTGTRNVK